MKILRKISYLKSPNSEPVPYIRLIGEWLSLFGFNIGADYKLTVEKNKIMLEAVEKDEVTE